MRYGTVPEKSHSARNIRFVYGVSYNCKHDVCAVIQHTVAVPVPHFTFHISRPGTWIPVEAIFCDVTPMTTHINQWIKLFQNILHWLNVAESWEKEKRRKNCLDWNLSPQAWKRGMWSGSGAATVCWITAHARHAVKPRCRGRQGHRPMIAYCFTRCSNGCSLGSFLLPRQQIHGQRCTMDFSDFKEIYYSRFRQLSERVFEKSIMSIAKTRYPFDQWSKGCSKLKKCARGNILQLNQG